MEKELIKEAEFYLDMCNSKCGVKNKYCIYCLSDKYDGQGIIHSDDCIIAKLRKYLDYRAISRRLI